MSIPVELPKLAEAVAERGPGYLLTSGPDGRPHTTEVRFAVTDATLRAPSGRRTAKNIADRPAVALLWPPIEPGGYSLIVDGDATIEGDDDTREAVIVATHAVLHRPAAAGGNDCKAV